MNDESQRVLWLREGLAQAGLDALVCALPMNVLLLSGYWPIVGISMALFTADGPLMLLAPEDERELADRGRGQVRTFSPGSLNEMTSAVEAVREPLREVMRTLGLEAGRIGYEQGAAFEPVSYASMHLYGGALPQLLQDVAPRCTLVPADDLLTRQRTVKTPEEIARIRTACHIAEAAFEVGVQKIRPGLSETEAAEAFCGSLSSIGVGFRDERALEHPGGLDDPGVTLSRVQRAGGFVFCMSGLNSAAAHGAYARSRCKRLAPGNLVLTHCNSYADGFWTDITRTYCLGAIDDQKRTMYEALFEARAAALAAIRPGALASSVDAAARAVLTNRGFGAAFKHPTGHGVGFAAIDHNAHPRLHPRSQEVLEEGMVFNVEPGIYLDGFGGMRHCDMVAVTAGGYELLTAFQLEAMAI